MSFSPAQLTVFLSNAKIPAGARRLATAQPANSSELRATPFLGGLHHSYGFPAVGGHPLTRTNPILRRTGVGHLALQLAKRLGARVLALASGDDGVSLARRLGADEAIEGHSRDTAAKARAFAPGGLDAALFLAGAKVDELLDLVRQGGRIAYPNGVEPEPSPRPGIAVEAFDGYHGREALYCVNRLVSAGPFDVEVSRIYALEETPHALRDVNRHHLGGLRCAYTESLLVTYGSTTISGCRQRRGTTHPRALGDRRSRSPCANIHRLPPACPQTATTLIIVDV
jgi:hypothetical protein